MIDIHSHILFNVDDGPKSLEESLEMLKMASLEGITEIISTSHFFHPQYNVTSQLVYKQVKKLQEELEKQQISLIIHTGHEVRLSDKLLEFCQTNQFYKLANSNYLLLELPSNNVPLYTKNVISSLVANDITPIIAHPERNKEIAEEPEKLEQLIREGAVAQITAGSLAGHFGRFVQKISVQLIQANLIHTYGSDVHNLTTRPFFYKKGLAYLEKLKLHDSIDIMLENNSRVIENIPLIVFEPDVIGKKKWWKVFNY